MTTHPKALALPLRRHRTSILDAQSNHVLTFTQCSGQWLSECERNVDTIIKLANRAAAYKEALRQLLTAAPSDETLHAIKSNDGGARMMTLTVTDLKILAARKALQEP